jgi:hypothetical protein
MPSPTGGSAPSPTSRPAEAAPATVRFAIVSALDGDSVTWTDGKAVPAQANNVSIVPMAGAAHQHTAPLSPQAEFFLPTDPNGVLSVDEHGYATYACTRQQMADYVVGMSMNAPELRFDSQGRIVTMLATYHP